MKSIILRINIVTYKRLRGLFAAQRGESAASYFERLYKWLDGVTIQDEKGGKSINGK